MYQSDFLKIIPNLLLNITDCKFVLDCGRMQRFREGIHIRTMKAKRKVEEISKEDIQTFLKKNAFVLFTVGAVIAGGYASSNSTEGGGGKKSIHLIRRLLHLRCPFPGIILGFALRPYKMSYREVKYFSFPGELLMRMLQMLVLPLLVSSLITGEKKKNEKKNRRLGHKSVSGS